ncbi:SLC6A14, partial [Cervus elaphus hippelaphus]
NADVAPENLHVTENDENQERGNWSKKSDYLLSMVGYAVGLGNVWRFPYLTYNNGGGTTHPPIYFPFSFKGGVGITMVLISLFVTIYYNVIIAYSLYYLFASFQRELPWSKCSVSWADGNCSRSPFVTHCNVSISINEILQANKSWVDANNLTCINGSEVYQTGQLPSEQYWNKVALQRSSGLDETGVIVWYLALCLLLSWLIVGAALCKGIKSSGKVVYFTALFPYVVLLILVIRGATLEGAAKGISYYIGAQSNFAKLKDAEFKNNCYSDAIVVCVTNCLTSVFAGFAIFSILGHMAHISGKEVTQVVKSGFDLAFIAYPEALAQLPGGPFWSVLFFFMLLTLGLDSQFASIGGNRFIDDIEMMIGAKRWIFWLWWRTCWFVITPILLM